MEIFKTLNSCNFCIYWCIDLKPAEIFQNRAIKKSLIQIFDDVIANHEYNFTLSEQKPSGEGTNQSLLLILRNFVVFSLPLLLIL